MRALGIDTTTPGGSLALYESEALLAVVAGDPSRTHGERLMTEIHRLLDVHGWRAADIDVYGVAAGPGSFTGLRIGIATVQGLAMVHERPVAAVSALDALARSAAAEAMAGTAAGRSAFVAALMDAHRDEVFWAVYESSPEERWRETTPLIEGPAVEPPRDVLERWSREERTMIVAGDGAMRYRQDIARTLGARAAILPAVPLLAPAIAAMAVEAASRGQAVAPHAIRPLYVRRPDAELAREARASRS
jgi:tRNA threonylcarbamoyladenosine biosynthesis protein TsaB